MSSPSEHDSLLDTIVAGRLETLPGPHATITARTLAPEDGTLMVGVGPLDEHTDALPRITLGGGGGAVPAELDLGDVLGTGGMGVVRRARQTALEREVAVKTLHPGAKDPGAGAELVEEARIMGRLEHPNIVPVHLLGRASDGRPVVVMKRLEGVPWRELARHPDHPAWRAFEGPVEDRIAHHLRIFMQVCHALEFAHRNGIVHRDVKPENVMVGAYGEVHLLDWGIALRLDRAHELPRGGVVGTPACIAPEMLTGDPTQIDERTDVYLAGSTLYEVLTGRPRHAGTSVLSVLHAAWTCAAPDFAGTDVPDELIEIVGQATAKARDDRPPSVRALRERISAYVDHRASLRLTDRADADAAELDEALAGASTVDDARTGVLAAFTRARHGYGVALETWPENVRAHRGQVRVLSRMLDHYLAARQDEAAAALLAELGDDAPPDRPEALARLRRELEAERSAHQELSSLRHELDLGVARRERGTLLAALGASSVVVTLALTALRVSGVDMVSNPALFGLGLAFAGGYGAGVFVARRRVLATRINRRIVLGVGVLLAGLVLNRGVGLLTGIAPELVLVYDLLALAVAVIAGSVTFDRRLAWLLVPALPGLIAAAIRPQWSQVLFPVVAMLVIGGVGVFLWRQRRQAA
jgi:serine/threonine-protein kinase